MGKGVWRCGKREIIYLSLHCHHQNDSCIKVGSGESHFNVSVGSDGQSHKTVSTNHNLSEEKGEPKRCRNEVLPLTSLTPYRSAKPAHTETSRRKSSVTPKRTKPDPLARLLEKQATARPHPSVAETGSTLAQVLPMFCLAQAQRPPPFPFPRSLVVPLDSGKDGKSRSKETHDGKKDCAEQRAINVRALTPAPADYQPLNPFTAVMSLENGPIKLRD